MRISRFVAYLGFALFLLTSAASAQDSKIAELEKKPYMQTSLTAFKKEEYFEAIALFKKAYTKEKSKLGKAYITFKIAECYRLINDTKQAEQWYTKAIKAKYDDQDPMAQYYLAAMMKINGKFAEASAEFNKYKQENPSDKNAAREIAACDSASKWKNKPTRYKIENFAQINTKFQDFGATYSKKEYKGIIFTSNREESTGKDPDGRTGKKYSDLFETTIDKKGKWSTPVPLVDPINTEWNEGAATLDKKGSDMFFTRCARIKNAEGMCKICTTKRKGTTWEAPVILPFNSDSFTTGHPSLSADEMQMYFSSSMPGGQGGKDIWMVTYDKKKKSWSEPVNLGASINTEGDEVFPFIHPDGTLYFSSGGHIGMGGLDIFKAKFKDGKWGSVQNMKYPINSEGDDFAIIFESETEKGYFSSNRAGGKGDDDLYSFYLPPLIFTLAGKVTDIDKGTPIQGAIVEVTRTDGVVLRDTADANGYYSFDKTQILPELVFNMICGAKYYFNEKGSESTKGREESADLIHDFKLKTSRKPIVLPNIEYDLDKATLRPISMKALDELVVTLNDNPNLVIELNSHTDTRATDTYNMELSQRRAESVVVYLISKGIDSLRLVPRGKGESEPRKIRDKDITVDLPGGKTITFKVDDLITDDFIAKLKTTEEKEAAHQLNRRTEFSVLRDNYVPGQAAPAPAPTPAPKQAPEVKPGTPAPKPK